MIVSMEIHTLLLYLASLLLLLLLGRKSKRNQKISRRRPPGPWGLPFVGSIHHLLTSQLHAALWDLAKKHGPVMYLHLGQVDAVVVSSPAAAQEVLQANDVAFASRPRFLGFWIVTYGNLDIAFSPYGAYWRTLRKLCIVELLSARKVKWFAPIRNRETLSLVKEVYTAGGGGSPVNLTKMLRSCTYTITVKATFGDYCSREQQEQFLSALHVTAYSSGFCVVDLFPSLWFVDAITGFRSRLQRAHRQFDSVFAEVLGECEARRKEKTTTTVGEEDQKEEDILSVLLRIRDDGGLEFPLQTENVKAIIFDIFVAGTETTASTAEWVMVELMRNPEAMAKAQAELSQAFNIRSLDNHEDHLDELPYMKMVIKETMRLHPPSPLLTRVCGKTCDVGGFEVMEGSRVFINVWAISTSSEYWDGAEEFKPERFEDSEVDYKGAHFKYLPFGSGRRMCPGMSFGLANLELIVARLLYYFDWSLPHEMRPEKLDMSMTVGAAMRRRDELYLVASPKIPLQIL